jgi:YggT family protein
VTGILVPLLAPLPGPLAELPLDDLPLPAAAGGAIASLLPGFNLLLGLALALWTLLFLFRIVLTWYPQVDLGKGVMRLVAIPTEPLLAVSRRLIQPIGGVDVTPVIWVGLISLLRELLVGQQGLLSLIALRAQGLVAAAS